MPQGLSDLARALFTQREQTIASFSVPVLVWEAPAAPNPDEAWVHTEAGLGPVRPRGGEPLVFNVEKLTGRKNAFSMGVTVGRVDTNDIQVDDASVSRFHAFLQLDAKLSVWVLSDADSKNGTFVDGIRLTQNERVRLRDGASVRFGEATMRFLLPSSIAGFIDGLATSRQGSKR